MDATCPNDVEQVLADANGEPVEVHINSPGGIIDVGSEIYTLLRSYKGDVQLYIVGEACSAASIIAMAGHCEMSPTALLMVHCVWTSVAGNHADLEHVAEMLRTADKSIANAYIAKTGRSEAEILEMMNQETWFTAEQAVEKGLVDAVMFDEKEPLRFAASTFALPTTEQMAKAKAMLAGQEPEPEPSTDKTATHRAQLSLLKLKGGHYLE